MQAGFLLFVLLAPAIIVLLAWLGIRYPKLGISMVGILLLVAIGLAFGMGTAALAVIVGAVCIGLWKFLPRLLPPAPAADQHGASSEDRRMVMQMLREGRITASEAQELLAALPVPSSPPADEVPVPRMVLASIIGGMVVTVGFVLPWTFIRAPAMGSVQMHGHQAGYHVGAIGWLILAIGLLPAVLATIPALDKGLRQGMLRAVLSSAGLALTLAILSKQPDGPGLWVCLAGFLVQLISAVLQARPVQPVSAAE